MGEKRNEDISSAIADWPYGIPNQTSKKRRFTITYEWDANTNPEFPCWAKCGTLIRCGATYTEARQRVLEALREAPEEVPAPPAEEVEV